MKFDLAYIRRLTEDLEGVDVEFKESTGQLDRGMETLCERAGLQPPKITDERGVVRVTFMRPDLLGHKNDTINGTINDHDTINDTINSTINDHDTINDTINGTINSNDTINDTINGTINSNDTINDPINDNDTIKDTEGLVYSYVVASPGISAVALGRKIGKSIITIKRALKILIEQNKIEYRGSKKTGGYYSL